MLSLQLLGGCSLNDDGKPVAGPVAQRRRLALLSVIASSGSTGVSRDKLVAFFWPEEDRERARHFLADSLFTIRKGLGKDVIITTGDDLLLNADAIRADVREFENLLRLGETAAAIALYRGPFLDGFFVGDAPEFERWADGERQRLASVLAAALEKLAEDSEKSGNHQAVAEWWKRLAAHDPYSSRVVLKAMKALERSGDPAAAIQLATRYTRLVRDDLELPPDAAVVSLAASLRSGPSSRAAPSVPAAPRATHPPMQAPVTQPQVSVPAAGEHRPRRRRRQLLSAGIAASLILAVVAVALQAAYTPRLPTPATRDPTPASAGGGAKDQGAKGMSEAEELYNQGMNILDDARAPEDFAVGAMHFQRALISDHGFAKAYAGLAEVSLRKGDAAEAKKMALLALSRDSSLSDAHAALAYVLGFYEHRWLAADKEIERAIRLSPTFMRAYLRRATINAALGRADIAMASLERAQQLEPQSWKVLYNRALVASALGRPKEAIRYFESTAALRPDRRDVKYSLANELWIDGRVAESAALYRSIGFLNNALIAEGDTTEMRRLVRRHETDSIHMFPTNLARQYARLGERDKAFRALKAAVKEDRFLPLDIRLPPLAWLKDDPRYDKVMADLGLR